MTDDAIWRVVQDVAATTGWRDRETILHLARAKLPDAVTMDRLSRIWSDRAEIKGAI